MNNKQSINEKTRTVNFPWISILHGKLVLLLSIKIGITYDHGILLQNAILNTKMAKKKTERDKFDFYWNMYR